MSDSAPASRRHRVLEGSTLGAAALLALALLVIVNYIGARHFKRFDWTKSRIYSLSEKTENVLEELDRDIEAVVFLSPAHELFEPVREVLTRYEAAAAGRFEVRVVDPERNPAEARTLVDRYQIASLDVVVFDSGSDRRVVESVDLADYDYSGMQFGQAPRMTGFKGEQAFTGAILELAEERKPTILFTTGHGELQIDDFSHRGLSQARDLLGRDNFQIESWASLGQPAVPEGTDLVVVAGPGVPFVEPEVDVLRAYLAGGGRLLLLLDPPLSESGTLAPTGLEELLAEHGVEVGADLVIDPANPLPFYGAETIFVDSFGDHPITRSLDQAQVPVILPVSRSVRAGGDGEGLEVVELLRTTDEGWGETDLGSVRQGRVEPGDDDLAGPVSVGVAVSVVGQDEAEVATGELGLEGGDEGFGGEVPEALAEPAAGSARTRLVVVGDSDFATNGQLMNVGNAPFLANALNWLVERETLVGIPPKEPEQVRLTLSAAQLRNLILSVLVLLPGLAIVTGVVVYLRRRR